jgi:hypothetical protein
MSPIKMLLGPPWTDTGEPGALANNDCSDACCEAFEGVLPGGQEMKNEVQDAVSNKVNRATRPIAAGILTTEVNAMLLSVSVLRRFGVVLSSSERLLFSRKFYVPGRAVQFELEPQQEQVRKRANEVRPALSVTNAAGAHFVCPLPDLFFSWLDHQTEPVPLFAIVSSKPFLMW